MRAGRVRLVAITGAVAAVTAAGTVAMATGDSGDRGDRGHHHGDSTISERLSGYEETPLALSTDGTGRFRARVDERSGTIRYSLRYSGLEGTVQQAHIHFGARGQSGGISTFLCSNLGNGPAGTQACPAAPATVTGTIRAADVIGPAAQGIAPGEFDELLAAVRAGATYANVHSSLYPGGEIRAQLED